MSGKSGVLDLVAVRKAEQERRNYRLNKWRLYWNVTCIWSRERMHNRKIKCQLDERRERIECKAVRTAAKESILQRMCRSWCVETNECRGNPNGRLTETCQEREKLPIGTGMYSWVRRLIWSKEKSKQNKRHEYLINDGETWWNDLGMSIGNWMDPNFKSHHALQKEKQVHKRMAKFNRKKEGNQT